MKAIRLIFLALVLKLQSWTVAIGAGRLGVIDDAIKSVAPYLDGLKNVGVSVRKMATAENRGVRLNKIQ
ncbi:hypothetical protein [Flavobacterium davisii]|uniref:Uncharacterized protein n=1 Tax=Flavobacterium columnare TaxID=996 RepID=A0A8G0KSU3_9FLAO|nr:hypothetical protein [Flavobacterium davisii]QYS89466.1 hypothetical protein JJC05_04085 [Flavobacterium davisii]